MWMAIALRSFEPGTIAFGRVLLGAAALALLPSARCRIGRQDWPRVLLAGLFGFALPFWMVLLAQERIPSAVAGMTVSILPASAALVAAIETRRWPRPARVFGLAVGMIGAGLLAYPNLVGTTAEVAGILLAMGSIVSYAVSSTLVAPLQQTYGTLRVTMWMLVVASLALLPTAIPTFATLHVQAASLGALLFLGVVGSGVVWVIYFGLVGRIGAVRAGIAGYFIPIVALSLGVLVLGEAVEPIQVVGVGIALAGAYVLGRTPPHHRPDGFDVCCPGDAPVAVLR